MTTNIHSINLQKIVQIGWGHHVDFCVWKNRPLLLAKGVYIIIIYQFRNKFCHFLGQWAVGYVESRQSVHRKNSSPNNLNAATDSVLMELQLTFYQSNACEQISVKFQLKHSYFY